VRGQRLKVCAICGTWKSMIYKDSMLA
jgi:hypothetical protein